VLRILLFSFTLLLLILETTGQTSHSLSLSNSTLVSTSDQMPFWLWANTDGKIDENNSFLNFSEINAAGNYFFNDSKSFIKAGAELNYAMGNNSKYFQANQLYTRINLNNWELNIGAYYNDLFFEGLSTSNGNIAKSRNARPYPKISLRITEYKPIPLIDQYLSFKAEYDEGILNDNRYVDKTHLHHKSFYLKAEPFQNFSIQAGAEHFVMWGGTSQDENTGQLPTGVNAYLRYITGSRGDEDFLPTDQLNVAGNQYGSYQLLLTQKFETFEAALNISHPFEDFSGVNLRNWPDNIIGLSLKLNDPEKFITHILYEYTNTRQQGITDSLYRWIEEEQYWYRIHTDSYFAHGVYQSGVTYHQKMMSSPLFKPVKIVDGISRGPESTRFYAHHIGLKGKLHKTIFWKGMLTYIKYFENWGQTNKLRNNQISALLHFLYSGEKIPFDIELTLAGDIADANQNKLGIQLGLSYLFNKK